MYLFTISYWSYAVDQRSWVGWLSGWSKIFVLCTKNSNAKFWKYPVQRSLQHWTESSTIPNSKERSVWRNKKPQKGTVSFVEDRSLIWSMSTSGSLEPMILSRIMPTCLQLFFQMMIFRNSILSGTEFYYHWRKSHLMTPRKDRTNLEYESLRNSRPHWNRTIWKFHQKKAGPDYHRLKTMVKRRIEHNLRFKNFEARNGNYERNAVVKNQWDKTAWLNLGDCRQWESQRAVF